MARPLDLKQVVAELTAELLKQGFVFMRKSTRGSCSRYLRWPGMPFVLRISDHQAHGFVLWRHPEIVKSYVPEQVPLEKIPAMAVEVRQSFFRRVEMRKVA